MPKAKIHGVDIYYEVQGDGETIVLLHHGMGCTGIWEKLIPGFKKKYRTITYDRRGFGKSDPGENFRDYYINDRYCQQSVQELTGLLDHLQVSGRVHVIGQCEGGAIGFHFATCHPDRIKTITASSTLCYSQVTMQELCEIQLCAFEEEEPEFREKVIAWHGATRGPELYNLMLQLGGSYGSGVFDLRDLLKRVQCPALVLYPDRSSLFDVEQGIWMYRMLPKGELAVLPNCGHNTYEQQPEDYQRIILSFLARHP
ncbi:MAG: alpha/beta hydrolase [Desulfobacterales bacterium]|nr:alpha/beta hydrolase [Desulfobacterales bacterium]